MKLEAAPGLGPGKSLHSALGRLPGNMSPFPSSSGNVCNTKPSILGPSRVQHEDGVKWTSRDTLIQLHGVQCLDNHVGQEEQELPCGFSTKKRDGLQAP